MQLKLVFAKWTKIASLILMGGAVAWAIKLSIIIATDGRIITTGAAALFMKIGILFFLVGSTAIGNHLSSSHTGFLRLLAILSSPVLVFGSFLLFGIIINPLFQDSSIWYAQQEAGIGVAAIVYFAVGLFLFRSSRPATA